MESLTEGRVVHYVLSGRESERWAREHRPAIVTKVCREESNPPRSDCADLAVYSDAGIDWRNDVPPMVWITCALFDKLGVPGTWHWIEKA